MGKWMSEEDHLRRGDIPIETRIDVRYEPLEKRYCARAEEFPDLCGLGPDPDQACLELRELIYRWATGRIIPSGHGRAGRF